MEIASVTIVVKTEDGRQKEVTLPKEFFDNHVLLRGGIAEPRDVVGMQYQDLENRLYEEAPKFVGMKVRLKGKNSMISPEFIITKLGKARMDVLPEGKSRFHLETGVSVHDYVGVKQ